ncbi:MAG: insulinase family protein [Planctomycetaceae bacterium]|nr:insulinase family protein [Planctomycetaceae bacterium]
MKKIILVLIVCLAGVYSVYAGAAEKLVYPSMQDENLPNGLRVILIEHHEQKTISYRMLVKAGKADEPIGKEGVAGFTSRVLQEGTLMKNADRIADEIAGIGSSFSISSQTDYVIFGMDVLDQYSQQGLDLFSDVILTPSFSAEGVKRVKKEMLNSVYFNQTDNATIAFNHGRALLFGCSNPLGRSNSKKSVQSISAKDIRKFYESHYSPGNSILLVIGDFSNDEMMRKLNGKFAGWKSSKVAEKMQTKPDYGKAGRILVVDKPRMTQAVIYMNQWALVSDDENYYDYILANYVLGGGGFSSRLMNAVRANGGMAYHISSRSDIHSNYGVLSIFTATRNEKLYDAYEMTKSEIEKLNDKGVSEEELQKAKDYVTGSIPLQLESPGQIANKILNAIMQGFTVEDLSNEVINYNNVTAENVDNVIKKYMQTQKLNVVIVCDVKKVKEQLKQIGEYEQTGYNDIPCK